MCLQIIPRGYGLRAVRTIVGAILMLATLPGCTVGVVLRSAPEVRRHSSPTPVGRIDPAIAAIERCHKLIRATQHAAALDACSVALQYRPDLVDLYVARSAVYLDLRQFDAAEADARTAVRLDPGSSAGFNNHGLALVQRGDVTHAVADFERAIALNPKNSNAYLNVGFAYRRLGVHQASLAAFERAVAVAPTRSMPIVGAEPPLPGWAIFSRRWATWKLR